MRIHLRSLILCFSLLSASTVFAQGNKDEGMWEFSFGGGTLLPDQLTDFTEMNGFWGLGAGLAYGMNTYSLSYKNSTGDGNQLHNLALDFRNDVKLSSLKGTVSGGLDVLGLDSPSRDGLEFSPGVHVGGGILALISKGLYFRMNMQFTAGTSGGILMFLDFGLTYRYAEDI